jgi:DNA-binding NarL/FixJ family response regulator
MSADSAAPIRILSVDDHPVLRQGVAALVVAEASNGREAIQQFRRHHPDVTLMDLQVPEMNGLDAIIAIRGEFPEARIMALKAGAQGYLLKNSLHKELLETIRSAHAGKRALSTRPPCNLPSMPPMDALTPAEVRVLRLIAEGNANKEIAAQLSVSEETVKGQVRDNLSKLGANDRTHAAMIGLKRGIIEF